jgi:hypothetical protein
VRNFLAILEFLLPVRDEPVSQTFKKGNERERKGSLANAPSHGNNFCTAYERYLKPVTAGARIIEHVVNAFHVFNLHFIVKNRPAIINEKREQPQLAIIIPSTRATYMVSDGVGRGCSPECRREAELYHYREFIFIATAFYGLASFSHA